MIPATVFCVVQASKFPACWVPWNVQNTVEKLNFRSQSGNFLIVTNVHVVHGDVKQPQWLD